MPDTTLVEVINRNAGAVDERRRKLWSEYRSILSRGGAMKPTEAKRLIELSEELGINRRRMARHAHVLALHARHLARRGDLAETTRLLVEAEAEYARIEAEFEKSMTELKAKLRLADDARWQAIAERDNVEAGIHQAKILEDRFVELFSGNARAGIDEPPVDAESEARIAVEREPHFHPAMTLDDRIALKMLAALENL